MQSLELNPKIRCFGGEPGKEFYAYMQAIGMVNDHLTTYWRYER